MPLFTRVGFRGVYPGIDLLLHGEEGELEYDFIVAPGADPSRIRLRFDAVPDVDEGGDLVLPGGVRHHKPDLYQQAGSRRIPVEGDYRVDGHEAWFGIGAYDRSRPLIIDPILTFSTFLGGTGNLPADRRDQARGVAVDAQGNIYVAGYAMSTNFPTTPGALRTSDPDSSTLLNASDAFVSKIRSDGKTLVYSTYLGGFGLDEAYGIAVDSSGRAVVVGRTQTTDFPVRNALQPSNRGGYSKEDAFVTKLNAAGNDLVFSTYLGGGGDPEGFGGNDLAYDVALDSAGAVYVTGRTSSPAFPTAAPVQASLHGNEDAFVAKIHADGSRLVYSSYLGGSNIEEGYDIAVDSTGHAFVTGLTQSTDFPTRNAFQPSTGGGYENQDAFVTELDPSGGILFSTYLGGSAEENPFFNGGIAVDGSGFVYVTGQTNSDDFPVRNARQPGKGGGSATFDPDAFVVKLAPGGSAAVYSTYLGGTDPEGGNGIACDGRGNAYVTGSTSSTDFPTAAPYQAAIGGSIDAFVTLLTSDGSKLLYSTYLGGQLDEVAFDIAVDGAGNAHVSGTTASDNFPLVAPVQQTRAGGFDGFVVRIKPDAQKISRPRAVRRR